MKYEDFTDLQLDIIKELVNIGGGNAATSISQLINKPVSMEVPTIEVLNYNELFETTMTEDTLVRAVIMRLLGDAEGIFLFITSDEASKNLVNMMIPEGTKLNEELSTSAIKELVNILVMSFLNAISKIVNKSLVSSVPILTIDMFGAILSSVYIESEQYDEKIMIIQNKFLYQGEKIDSSLYFIPKPGVLERLFKILDV